MTFNLKLCQTLELNLNNALLLKWVLVLYFSLPFKTDFMK